MLQPKKSTSKKELDKYLKSFFKQELEKQKQDENNPFKPPISNKYKRQLQESINNTPQLKQDNSTEKDREFNKNYHDQKEWDAKKWGIYENIATTAELGNFIPHPVPQAVGKAGSIASVALAARKAKLAYDNEDYVNMGLNLGMMGLSGKMGSTTFAKNTVKGKNLDSFEKLISPKEFKSNIVNGYEIGRMETNVPSYINVLNKKSGQNTLDLAKNRGLLGVAGADYFTDFNTKQEQNTQLAMGGNLNQNNMRRYAQGGDLTQFNEGGLHSQNPLGGVPIGNNNSVEQGETLKNNFVYSNRIFLDNNIVSQYNLPKSLVGKSVADATKFIDNKFKGRNDKISQSTKNGMLSKIAEAQEAMKPQEPEMEQTQEGMEQQISPEMMGDPSQMAWGGFADSTIGQGFGKGATGAQQSAAVGAGLGTLTAGLDLGMTAFGKPAQDTSGLAASAPVNSGAMIGGSALKGASAGMAFGPLGAGIGAVVGAGAGLLGSNKAKKAAIENTNNYAVNVNKQFSDQYAMGGEIDPPTKGDIWQTKNIVKYQPGVTSGEKGESGFYLYSKDSSDPTFNYKTDREFVRNSSMNDLQKTAQWQNYMRSKSMQPKQLADGGPITGYGADGRWIKPVVGEADYNTNIIQNVHDAIGITPDIPGYGNAWGDKSNEALRQKIISSGQTPTKSKYNFSKEDMLSKPLSSDMGKILGLTPEGYKFTPETPVFPQKTDPVITPTQTKAGFEAYYDNAKQTNNSKKENSSFGKTINNNLGNIARYAPIAANALQLAQLKKPQGERLDRLDNRYRPEYVDEAQLQNIANQTMNNSVNAIGQSGASQGQLRSSIIGSQLQRTKAISDSYAQAAAQNRQQNAMAQEFNLGVDRVNLQQSNTEKENFARDKGAYDTEKSKLIGKIGENIGNVGTEQAYKKIAVTTTGYNWLGEFQKMNPNATKEETIIAAKKAGVIVDDTKTTKKNALGGYLIKNKVK